MTDLLDPLSVNDEASLEDLLEGILTQFGGAVEFWTLVCLSKRELGDSEAFVDRQCMHLREQVQRLRRQLTAQPWEPSDAVLEQVIKLLRACAELREVFDYFIHAAKVPLQDLEAAVMKLSQIWQDARMRVWLIGALIFMPRPPALSSEKEAYYQTILDGLFDQFLMVRSSSNGHARNGKMPHN